MKEQKRKVPDRPLYHVLDAIGLAVLIGIFLYLIFMWKQLPDRIPRHFNATGVADAWGGKGMLWFCPVTAALLYGMITLLEQFPDIWNTGVEVTPENQERVLGAVKLMVVWMKLALVLDFAWITLCSARGTAIPIHSFPVAPAACFVFQGIRSPAAENPHHAPNHR